jgi:Ni/Fe-hydrogenase subunit HybB-like protein
LLIGDLEHPARFYLIFTRPQWKSWLVKGAFIIAAYAAVLTIHVLASLLGFIDVPILFASAGLPLAVMTAVYTAYLFAQAKARDLWQNPLLPAHLVVQAVLAGAAVFLPIGSVVEDGLFEPVLWILGASALAHVLLVWGEITLAHPTAHARLAVEEMTRGRYRTMFRAGVGLTIAAVFSPWLGLLAAPLALIGLAAYEHAYVQAGQAVPIA